MQAGATAGCHRRGAGHRRARSSRQADREKRSWKAGREDGMEARRSATSSGTHLRWPPPATLPSSMTPASFAPPPHCRSRRACPTSGHCRPWPQAGPLLFVTRASDYVSITAPPNLARSLVAAARDGSIDSCLPHLARLLTRPGAACAGRRIADRHLILKRDRSGLPLGAVQLPQTADARRRAHVCQWHVDATGSRRRHAMH